LARADFGYDPIRMTALHTETRSAVTALRAISSSDPSAQRAVAAVNRLRSTLEVEWLPAIRAVRSSTALSGDVAAHALGGDDADFFGRFRVPVFQVGDPLSALFPGDDDVTAEEIAAKIAEILGQQPSGRQFIDLGILGRALAEIAEGPELSADFLEEIGPDGLQEIYTQLFRLGLAYPYALTNPESPDDQTRLIGNDLALTIGDSFNLVVAAGAKRPAGRRVVSEAIAELADAGNAWEAAGLGGLARVEGLPPGLARELFDAVTDLGHEAFALDLNDRNNSVYPELEWDYQDLQLFVIARNPILVHDLIHDHDGFVDGGERLLRDLVGSKASYWRTEDDIAAALGRIFGHVIEFTAASDLIERRPDGGPDGAGVLFDLVDILLEEDLKVSGIHVLQALGPFLPEIVGAIPGSATPYTPQQVRSILKDLFQDLSPTETEAALVVIVASSIAKVPLTITSADFDGTEPAGIAVGDLLDSLFGPAVGALDDVVDDKETQVAFWRAALNAAFGLIPLPGSSLAKFAIRKGVREIIDGLIPGTNGHGSEVAGAQEALIANTVTALHTDPAINTEVVVQALGDWERTAKLLGGDANDRRGGHELSDTEIERIRRALVDAEEHGTSVPADVFVRLPQIVDLVESLEDELTLSPERLQGN